MDVPYRHKPTVGGYHLISLSNISAPLLSNVFLTQTADVTTKSTKGQNLMFTSTHATLNIVQTVTTDAIALVTSRDER